MIRMTIINLSAVFGPLGMTARLWRSTWGSWLGFGSELLSVWSVIGFVFIAGPWAFAGIYLRYLLLCICFSASVGACIRVSKRGLQTRSARRATAEHQIYLALGFLFLALTVVACMGRRAPGQPVDLSFPLRQGAYWVCQGGSNILMNQHVVGPHPYAVDIVKLNAWGTRASGVYPGNLDAYAIYGETVYSPCTGQILVAVDGHADCIPPDRDRQNPLGNYLVIRCGPVAVCLAHLLPGSLQVRAGDNVEEGQPVARVGNSGNSTEPHLHVHVVSVSQQGVLQDSSSLPIVFGGRPPLRNTLFRVQ